MTVSNIPIKNAETLGTFTFTVDLEGTDWEFDFKYNDRDSHWYFDLYDIDRNLIRAGVKAVINWPVIRLIRDTNRPLGEVMFVSTSGTGDPVLANLGTDVVFCYIPSDDLP